MLRTIIVTHKTSRKFYTSNRITNYAKMSKSATRKKHLTVAYEEEDSKKTKFIPKNWQNVLDNVRQMRNDNDAPVDSMGCEKIADQSADEKTKRFQILIALLLSSQTKDAITFGACEKLKTFGFTPVHLAKANLSEMEDILKPVGFYKTKAKNVQKTSQICVDEYQGDIPGTLDGLLKLPGVGPKMAHICMSVAWNIVSGIGVDIHVHRIANRLQWTSKLTKDPEKTRMELESWLPFELWGEVNLLLVGFGQTICLPKSPKCDVCLNNKLCPSAFKESPKKKK
ncbi:CLUMA_CG013252, isoform A [Clunio marinus]|uniref:Endonuclease III homolog n=1 Tax=Clunio marinus TaxID=568069 RepID=A0A1J1IIB1_9DIPT|nr:CLUMA_CG013252, isoform A [Clunio marinus]